MKATILSLLLSVLVWSPMFAQSRNKSMGTKVVSAEQLINEYKFDEAAQLLQKQIKSVQKSGGSTDGLERELHRANLGADLLRGVTKVIFVDSIKVLKSTLPRVLSLSSECGQIISMEDQKRRFSTSKPYVGDWGYINDLGDRILFAAGDSLHGTRQLYSAYLDAGRWGQPELLEGLATSGVTLDNPFAMPDGVTLYFASKGEGSVGGYDLFVTRYDPDRKEFLKAENLGMPFNSPANDYLLAIDEPAQLGYLVTDRHQRGDTVCIYTFIPTEDKEVYDETYSAQTVLHAAMIHSVKESQTNPQAVKQALARLQAAKQRVNTTPVQQRRYIISNKAVYTSLEQFRRPKARQLAIEADRLYDQIQELLTSKDYLLRQAAQGNRPQALNNQLRQINTHLPELEAQYKLRCKQMRQEETR